MHNNLTRKQLSTFVLTTLVALGAALCFSCKPEGSDKPLAPAPDSGSNAGTAKEAEDIVQKNQALDNSHDSISNVTATIQEEGAAVKEVSFNIYKKALPDGGQSQLIEFTAPAVERDRDALIAVSPKGDIEATRYVQSSDSYLTSKNASDEDALFGLSLQELVGGQPAKYNYTLDASAASDGTYHTVGALKPGADARFSKVADSISRDDYSLKSVEAYDSRNQLARRITVTKTEKVGGYSTRMEWKIDNLAKKKVINFKVTGVKYDTQIPDSTFTKDHLKKIASK